MSIIWKHYTVGFYFTEDLSKVLLIRKAKPQWQMGRLNGIGGAFETVDGNIPERCMDREFREETEFGGAYNIPWRKFAEGEIRVHQGDCFLHYMVATGPEFHAKTSNNEIPVWVHINPPYESLPYDIVPNLAFLVPMAKIPIIKPWWSEIATFRTLI